MTTEPERFCATCKHETGNTFYLCKRLPPTEKTTLVRGRRWIDNYSFCWWQRLIPWLCGRRGRHWEPKEPAELKWGR